MGLDTPGELQNWNEVASILLDAKSLTPRAGQNPVIPMLAGETVRFATGSNPVRVAILQPPLSDENLLRTVNRSRLLRFMNSEKAVAEQLTVIIPTLNEAPNIQPLLARIFEQSSAALQIEVLFVDDGST